MRVLLVDKHEVLLRSFAQAIEMYCGASVVAANNHDLATKELDEGAFNVIIVHTVVERTLEILTFASETQDSCTRIAVGSPSADEGRLQDFSAEAYFVRGQDYHELMKFLQGL